MKARFEQQYRLGAIWTREEELKSVQQRKASELGQEGSPLSGFLAAKRVQSPSSGCLIYAKNDTSFACAPYKSPYAPCPWLLSSSVRVLLSLLRWRW